MNFRTFNAIQRGLKLNIQPVPMANSNNFSLPASNSQEIRETIADLENARILFPALMELKSNPISRAQTAYNLNRGGVDNLRVQIERVKEFLNVLDSIYRADATDEDPSALQITIPDSSITFDRLTIITSELNRAFSVLHYLPNIEADIKITDASKGSLIFTVVFGSIAALYVIGTLAENAIQLQRQEIKDNEVIETVRDLTRNNSNINISEIESELKTKQKHRVEQTANKLYAEIVKDNHVDNVEDVKNKIEDSISKLGALYEKEIILTPSVTAPEDLQNIFPTAAEIKLLHAGTKEIGPGNNNTN